MNSPQDKDFCKPSFWNKRFEESKSIERAVQDITDWASVGEAQKQIFDQFVGGKVLDAGCGFGRVIEWLPWKMVTEYVGMDITPMFIDEAKERYPNHKFILGDIQDTGFDDKAFDWGLAIGIVDSIYWPKMAKELKRVCKKVLMLRCEKLQEYTIL